MAILIPVSLIQVPPHDSHNIQTHSVSMSMLVSTVEVESLRCTCRLGALYWPVSYLVPVANHAMQLHPCKSSWLMPLARCLHTTLG